MFRVAAMLAFRQLTHRGTKLIGALLGVSVAIVLMFTQLGFESALYDSAVAAPRALHPDIILTTHEFRTMSFNPPWLPRRNLYEAESVPGVASAAPLYMSTVQVVNPVDGNFLTTWLYAFDPARPVFNLDDVNHNLDLIQLPETAIIDRGSRNELGAIARTIYRTGKMDLMLPAAELQVQPVFRIEGTFSIGATINIDGNLITSDLNYYRYLGVPLDRVSLGVVRVASGYDPATVQRALQQRFGGLARVFLKDDFIDNEIAFYENKTPIGFIFDAGLVVGVLVGIVFISQVLHGIVNDNIREYATLRAVGYKQSFFITLVGIIAIGISVTSYVPSAIVSYLVYQGASAVTRLPMIMKLSYLIEVFVLVVGMGLIATILSTNKLKQADPVDLF